MVTTTAKLADKIHTELNHQNSNKYQLAQASGISHTTLNRKLADEDQFTMKDIAKIATALGIHPSELASHYFGQAQP